MKRALIAAGLGLASLSAQADLSFSQRIDVEGAGAMSMFSSSGTVLTQIAGDRSRSESDVRMNSKLANMMNRRTATVVRLDRQAVMTLDLEKQTYTEQTFAELRQQMKEAEQSMAQMRGSGQQLPVTEDGCQFTEQELTVDRDKKRVKVAGIKTNKHTIRLKQSCRDRETGQTCDLTWILETWLAKKVPARKEVEAFQRAYAKAIGIDKLMQQAQGPGQTLLTMFDDNWGEVAQELSELEGYPLKSVMQMGIGGEQCLTASGNPIAMDEVWADAGTAAYNAALDQTAYQAGSAVGREAGRALGDSVGGAIGGAAVGAAAGELIGGFTGMFKKKKPSEEPRPEAETPPAAGQVTAFRIASEVTDWSEVTIPADRFEAPPGWQRK